MKPVNKQKNELISPQQQASPLKLQQRDRWQKKVAKHIRKRLRTGYDFLASVGV